MRYGLVCNVCLCVLRWMCIASAAKITNNVQRGVSHLCFDVEQRKKNYCTHTQVIYTYVQLQTNLIIKYVYFLLILNKMKLN